MPSDIRTETLTQTGFKRKKETHDLTHQETGSTGWMEGCGCRESVAHLGHRSPRLSIPRLVFPCCKMGKPLGWAAFSTPAPGSGPAHPWTGSLLPALMRCLPHRTYSAPRGARPCARGLVAVLSLRLWAGAPDKPRLPTPGQAGLAQPLLQEGELTLGGDRSGNKISIPRLQTQTDAQSRLVVATRDEVGRVARRWD